MTTKQDIDELYAKIEDMRRELVEAAAAAIIAALDAGAKMKDIAGLVSDKATKTKKPGVTVAHPSIPDVIWNGRGRKPGWVVELESKELES